MSGLAAGGVTPSLGLTPMTAGMTAGAAPGPILVSGLPDPGVLLELSTAITETRDGYTPRITVVEPDERAAREAMRVWRQQTDPARCPPIELLAGEHALRDLERSLAERRELELPSSVLGSDPAGRVAAVLADARRAQAEELRRALARVRAARVGRDRGWWARRYEQALAGGPPLRVLAMSSRYSTFVRHSIDRFVRAVEGAGHETRLLIEPAADAKLSALAYALGHETFDPDLVVSINWPRAVLGESAWPGGVPSVCWVQDMLGHLLDRRVGEAQTELDFMIGQVHGALFRDYGYPPRNRLFVPTPACSRQFAGSSHRRVGSRYDCDVAYLSHQSGDPSAFVADAITAHAGAPGVEAVLRRIDADVRAALGDASIERLPDLWRLTADAIEAATGSSADPSITSRFHLTFTLPLAERVHRHVTLDWAAEICRERGLSLGLFGRGWDAHPRLSRHARGEVEHDGELPAAYATPACHLHASLCTNAHQRVFECALAGGLMLRRGPTPDASAIQAELVPRVAAIPGGVLVHPAYRVLHVPSERRAPDDERYDAVRHAAALGVPEPVPVGNGGLARVTLNRYWPRNRPAWMPRARLADFPDWAYDTAGETMFCTKSELGWQIERAVSDRGWRDSAVADHRSRAGSFSTYDSLWDRLLRAVTRGLTAAAGEPDTGRMCERESGVGEPARLRANLASMRIFRPDAFHALDAARPTSDTGPGVSWHGIDDHGTRVIFGVGDGERLPTAAHPTPGSPRPRPSYIIEPNAHRLLAAMRRFDLTAFGGPIETPSVRWFVGADWAAQLRAALLEDPSLPLPGRVDDAELAAVIEGVRVERASSVRDAIAVYAPQSTDPDDVLSELQRLGGTSPLGKATVAAGERIIASFRGADPVASVDDVRAVLASAAEAVGGGTPDGGWLRRAAPALVEKLVAPLLAERALEVALECAIGEVGVYGPGWDRHPRLAAHARGDLPPPDAVGRVVGCAGAWVVLGIDTGLGGGLAEACRAAGVPVLSYQPRHGRGDTDHEPSAPVFSDSTELSALIGRFSDAMALRRENSGERMERAAS